MLFIGIAGVPGSVILVVLQTQVQRQTPDQLLGRVSSAFTTVELAATLIGATIGSVLGEMAGLGVTFHAAVVLVPLTAELTLALLPRNRATPPPATCPPVTPRSKRGRRADDLAQRGIP
jgi:predicted MFS family arabinose efflux permease